MLPSFATMVGTQVGETALEGGRTLGHVRNVQRTRTAQRRGGETGEMKELAETIGCWGEHRSDETRWMEVGRG